MIDSVNFWIMAISLAAGAFNLLLGTLKRLPSLVSLGALATVEAGLLVIFGTSIILLASGQSSNGNIFEFFGYVLVALIVPAGAGFWALIERTRQSTLILGIAPIVVTVMIARMGTIWFG